MSDAALLLWVGWAVTYGLVLSYAGGIFHAYYLAAMTPPVCALAAIGLVRLWRWYREGDRRALMLPLMLIALAAWYLYIGQGYLASLQSNPQRAVLASAQVQAAHDLQHILVTATFVSALLAIAGLCGGAGATTLPEVCGAIELASRSAISRSVRALVSLFMMPCACCCSAHWPGSTPISGSAWSRTRPSATW